MEIEAPTRVFWAPGCTSCLRTKEFLTRMGIPFESVNVAADPGAMEALRALGARSVPIVSQGSRYVYAQSIADVKAFLKLDVADDERLPPAELARRLNVILTGAMRYASQMSDETLDGPFLNSWAPPRGLAHHVFRVTEAFLETREQNIELGYDLIMQGTHEVEPGQDVVGYGADVLRRFNDWWAANSDSDWSSQVPTYYGDQTLHEVFERTTWHSAQHTRQLMFVLETIGTPIDRPLTKDDLAGLPLPERAWDA